MAAAAGDEPSAKMPPPELPAATRTDIPDEGLNELNRQLGVLICLPAAKVSEPRLACYGEMPDAQIHLVGHEARSPAPNLIRLRARRLPYFGAPERWTAALGWFRGLANVDPGPIDCVLSMELFSPTSLQASRLAQRLGAVHVVTIAEVLPKNPLYALPPWRQVSSAVSRSADAFVCSVDLARRFALARGCPADRCVVINPGIDLTRFVPRVGGRATDPVMLFVGELRPDKGIRNVIAAVKSAREQIPDVRLIIVGDGPLREEIKAQSQRQPFIDYRATIGRDELPGVYQEARGFILAPHSRRSWAEQFGFASVEALASGLPVVITDCGAVREVIPEWNPICTQHDVSALTAGIVAALGDEGDEWGKRNRESAEQRFDIDVQAARLREWLGEQVALHR